MFSSKWEKEPRLLKFTIHTIAIKKNLDDQFKVNWKRGECKGSTSRVIAMNKILTFNEPFECKCTMYISKNDKTIRPKFISFHLVRINPQNDEQKVFGRAKIDLAQFYNQSQSTTFSVDMESKHGKKPKMTVAFQILKNGPSSEISSEELKDTQDSTISTDMWDTTEKSQNDGNNKKPPSNIHQNTSRNGSTLVNFKKTTSSRTKNMTPVSLLMPSKNLVDFIGLKNKEHIKLFESVLEVAWPIPLSPSFISMPYQYPPAVFPIFATFLKSRIFEEDEPLEDNLYDNILDLMLKAPLSISCSNEKRFVTFLTIYILLNALYQEYGLDKSKIDDFSNKLKLIVDKSLIQFERPLLGRAEQFYSHFLSASFEIQELIEEYFSTIKDIQTQLIMPTPIKNIVLNSFHVMMDARLLTKILTNPSLLTFQNAMIWSSFMTASESAGHSLVLTSQASKMLMMSSTIAEKPELAKEICPDLSPSIVLFLLSKITPDEIMPKQIDITQFSEYYGIEVETEISEIIPPINQNYLDITSSIRVQDWCRCELQAEVVAKFPFFKEYLVVEPTLDF